MKIDKILDLSNIKSKQIKDFLLKINSIERDSDYLYGYLYESRNNTEYILNRTVDTLLRTGRIKLKGFPLKNSDDIVALSNLIGNRATETTRVIYVKDGVIVGDDAITLDLPSECYSTVPRKEYDKTTSEEDIKFCALKAEKLNADEVYYVHNHPTGSSKPTAEDINSCKDYEKWMPNFVCGIIIGENNYSIFLNGSSSGPYEITVGEYESKLKRLDTKSKVISEVRKYNPKYGSSYVVYLNIRYELIAIQRISNVEFEDKNIMNYLKNETMRNGAEYCVIYTEDEELFTELHPFSGIVKPFLEVLYSEDGIKYQSANDGERMIIRGYEWPGRYKAKKL